MVDRGNMSMTRVAAVDGLERQRRGSNVTEARRMSFNPVSDWVPPKDDRRLSNDSTPLAFEEVSKRRRIGKHKQHKRGDTA